MIRMPLQSGIRVEICLILAAFAQGQQTLPAFMVEPARFMQTAFLTGQEEPKSVQVKGKVVDRQGKGITDVEVTIEGPKGSATKKTGNGGVFTFEGPPGNRLCDGSAAVMFHDGTSVAGASQRWGNVASSYVLRSRR
jgi:hypothetical protein